MTGGASVEVDAPAKINLFLRVLERRPDGYHELDTLFQSISLRDTVRVTRGTRGATGTRGTSPVSLEVAGMDVGPDTENLAFRAAELFMAASGVEEGVRIQLTKRIPAGAGLGGGSSDAAATLRAMNALFDLPLDERALHHIGSRLGADVPFFLQASPTALGSGRGDRLQSLSPLPSCPGVVVVPDFAIATAAAYELLAAARSADAGASSDAPHGETDRVGPGDLGWSAIARIAVNDFGSVLEREHPQLGVIRRALEATNPIVALLSGSGSALFAVYEDEHEAEGAAQRLAQETPNVAVHRVWTLERICEPIVIEDGVPGG